MWKKIVGTTVLVLALTGIYQAFGPWVAIGAGVLFFIVCWIDIKEGVEKAFEQDFKDKVEKHASEIRQREFEENVEKYAREREVMSVIEEVTRDKTKEK